MRVRNLLQRKGGAVITVGESETVWSAVRTLHERGIGGVAVIDEHGALSGFLSERDVVEALIRHAGDVRELQVAHVMRRPPACGLEDDVTVIMQRMTSERVRHFVAVDQGRPVGVISVGDIVKQRLVELETETGVLRDYVAGQRAV
jgi:CBS domain-containing protein